MKHFSTILVMAILVGVLMFAPQMFLVVLGAFAMGVFYGVGVK